MDTLRGISGWVKVDRLAAELVTMAQATVYRHRKWTGLSSCGQSGGVRQASSALHAAVGRPSTGRFTSSKHRSEHFGVEAVGR